VGKVYGKAKNSAGYLISSDIKPEPCVGTGRFLIQSTLKNPKAPLVLFGIEIDPSLYRACLVNMALFSNHPYSIVCGDTLMIDTPFCSPGSKLWDQGNQWNPPDISKFYFKLKPPFKFSLAALAKARKEQPIAPIVAPQSIVPETQVVPSSKDKSFPFFYWGVL